MSFDLKIINGDFSLKNGDVETVVGEDKLIQDILKIALTTAGSNPMQPWYGSFVARTLIGSHIESDVIFNIAKNQLQSSIENLKKLQQIQASEILQKVRPDEQIAAITDISINRNSIDPRLYDVIIKVLTRAFKKVNTTFTITNTV